jgi:hypothetical protein
MRSIDAGNTSAINNARDSGLVERDLLTIFARNRSDNSITTFPFWTEPMGDDVAITVIAGADGSSVSRTFIGGAIMSIGDVPNVADLTIRRVPVTLSQIHPTVASMFRTYDIRVCAAEIHRALLDPVTRNLVGAVYCHFVGQVNMSPLTTPAVEQEGGLAIEIVSDTRELTRTNPARRSDTTQSRRSGDRMLKYASLTSTIVLPWGEKAVGAAPAPGSH